jgi:HEAT repeat protein
MLDCEPYESKLIRALRHPEPLTRRRAVRILGERRVGEAIPALLLCASNGADPYLRAEVVLALQQIGTSSAASALARLAADPSVIVQQALRGDRAPPRGPRTHRS